MLEVAQLRLDEMIKSQSAKEISIGEHIKQFAVDGVLRTAFVAVCFSMLLLLKLLRWISNRKEETRRTYYQRIITLCYHFLMGVLAIAAAFYVLSVRNDQVLIGITVLLLLSIVLLLKNSISSYINELRILLNTGSVREGECVIYNGIPMQVESLNYYTKLINPMLPGLELRLTLAELANYVSVLIWLMNRGFHAKWVIMSCSRIVLMEWLNVLHWKIFYCLYQIIRCQEPIPLPIS